MIILIEKKPVRESSITFNDLAFDSDFVRFKGCQIKIDNIDIVNLNEPLIRKAGMSGTRVTDIILSNRSERNRIKLVKLHVKDIQVESRYVFVEYENLCFVLFR
jgi:hypothetical protein